MIAIENNNEIIKRDRIARLGFFIGIADKANFAAGKENGWYNHIECALQRA